MIAAENYVHYSFDNSGIKIQSFEAQRQRAYQTALARFEAQTAALYGNEAANKMLVTLDDSMRHSLEQELQKQDVLAPTAATEAYDGASFGQLGRMKATALKAKTDEGLAVAKTLTDNIATIIANMEQTLNEVGEALNQSSSVAKAYALKSLAAYGVNNEKGMPPEARAAAQRLVSDVINRKMVMVDIPPGMSKDDVTLAKLYHRLGMRLMALKALQADNTLGPSKNKDNKRINYAWKIADIAGSFGGGLTNIGGIFREATVGAAAANLLDKEAELAKQLFQITDGGKARVAVTGAGGISAQIDAKTDPNLKTLVGAHEQYGTRKIGEFNKNDITLYYAADKTMLTYGISVKNTNANFNSQGLPTKPIKIMDTNLSRVFSSAAGKDGIFSGYTKYNIAAGHTEKNGLAGMWRSYVDYAIALNFVDYLVGDGSLYSHSRLLVVNNSVYTMKSILEKIKTNFGAVSHSWGGAYNRGKFTALNVWQDDKKLSNEQDAKERSDKLAGAVEDVFKTTSIKIDLSLAALGRL